MIFNVENPNSSIGDVLTETVTNITMSAASIDTMTDGASLTLGAGTWIVDGYWQFNTRAGSGASNRQIVLRKDGANIDRCNQRIMNGTKNYSTMHICSFMHLTTSAVISVGGACSEATQSASYLDASKINAVRIA